MNGRPVRAGVAGALVVLALAGCSGGNDSDSGGAADMAAVAPAQPAPDAATGAADGGSAAERAPEGSTGTTGDLALQPALIRTAELSVAVDDVPARAGEAASLARAAGGAVAGDDRSGDGDSARATLVLKVPPARMDGLLDQVGGLGDERRRVSSSEDVTEDVADVQSRVATMQASIARVRAILSRADRIGDVVAVEGELSRRVTELESLQARQRALAGRTGYATVTVRLYSETVRADVAPAEESSGFLGGLEDGWSAFTATVGWLLMVLGALLPFLIILIPAAYVALRLRRKTRPAAPAPDPAP
jgi:hypothetical protein